MSLHVDDDVMQERWVRTPPSSRICYHVAHDPGARLSDPHTIDNSAQPGDDGAANFTVVRAVVDKMHEVATK